MTPSPPPLLHRQHRSHFPFPPFRLSFSSSTGAGIVGIPYAIQQAGFCAGLVLIVVVAILTETSLRWLINTAKHVHVGSYETLAEAAFGKAGFRFVALNMFVMAYGAMLTYLMIVKDTYATVLLGKGTNESILIQKRAVLLVVSLAVMVPLSSQRDMAGALFGDVIRKIGCSRLPSHPNTHPFSFCCSFLGVRSGQDISFERCH